MQNTCITKEHDSEAVSSCMSLFLSSTFPLLHVPIIVNQDNRANLLVEKAMIDTGSQICIANRSYVEWHKFIDFNQMRPMLHNCSLKSTTGRSFNPFAGKINLDLRFLDKQKKATKKVSVEFHILAKENDLNNIYSV